VTRQDEAEFDLRWFTPAMEVDLCGHATLAAAHILWSENISSDSDMINFHSNSGVLAAARKRGQIELDFPATPAEEVAPPEGLLEAIGNEAVRYVGQSSFDQILLLANEEAVRGLSPDFDQLARLTVRGVVVTREPENASYDFVSRYFAPAAGIDEFAVDHAAVGGAVVAEVRGDRAGAEVDAFAEDGVADVGEVADVGAGEDDGVFDFDRLADVAVVADGGMAAEVAIRADFAVFADDDVALDVDAGEDAAVGSEVEASVDDRVRAVVDRMIDLCRQAEGIGLAANQVGLPWRLFICDVPEGDGRDAGVEPPTASRGPTVFINPELSDPDGPIEPYAEGCLSLPGITGEILRPPIVTVTALDLEGAEFTLHAGGLLARCVQHEHDHLDGVLIIDKMTQMSRMKNRALVRAMEREAGER